MSGFFVTFATIGNRPIDRWRPVSYQSIHLIIDCSITCWHPTNTDQIMSQRSLPWWCHRVASTDGRGSWGM